MARTVKDAFLNGKAFIAFITAGDPSLEKTEEYILEMERAGADLIEIGIPFSDPIAEGIVIQEADLRALRSGTTTDKIFDMVSHLRQKTDMPLVFMGYLNPVFHYGYERFFGRCEEVGISGIIIPDLPYEEKGECEAIAAAHGVDLISMVAPTSGSVSPQSACISSASAASSALTASTASAASSAPTESTASAFVSAGSVEEQASRISTIAAEAKGFVYVVSSMGVTGVRSEIKTNLESILREIRAVTDVPAAVGFGINTPEQAARISKIADGVIVGSAIVKLVAQYGECASPHIYDYVKAMKDALSR